MIVNFNNFTEMVSSGQKAYDGGGFGSPIADSRGVTTNDHQIADYAEAANLHSINHPNDFVFGFSGWGSQTDKVTI